MSTQDLRDAVTKSLFDPSTVTVNDQAGVLGWLPLDALIRLAGAPRESTVTASFVEKAGAVVVEFRVSNSTLFLSDLVLILFQLRGSDQFALVLSATALQPLERERKLGTRIFATIAHEAANQGFLFIEADAIGNQATMTAANPKERYNGQYSWARMGFDADISPNVLPHCVGELTGLTRVHQLMESPAGRDIWRRHAESLWLRFDLRRDSICWNTLNRYTREKGIRVTP